MPQAARRGGGVAATFARTVALLAAMLVPAQAAPRACHLYRALEQRCHCPDDYFGSYGRKYCERFMQANWSPAGLRWRDRTADDRGGR